jgi:gliding motility-associated-like protein
MQRLIITLLLALLPFFLMGQFCSGSLGDNIFEEGDFGSGSANILSPDPNIAPGYNYTFNVPPLDGDYVITNSTAAWPGLFTTWLGLRDNSLDPNGYMMVVNATNTPGLFYEQSVTGLCENTLYEFSADIINLIRSGIPDHIAPDVSFLIDGTEFFTTGDIPQSENWISYGFTFTTQVGQQSIVLSLRNNAPGGFGNDLALDNISFRACGPEITVLPESTNIDLCKGDELFELEGVLVGNQYVTPTFQWQLSLDAGQTWDDISGANQSRYFFAPTTEGTFYIRFLVADGIGNLSSENCRVSSETIIINVISIEITQSVTICEGQILNVGNSSYTIAGTYLDTIENVVGCDSIITTELSVSNSDEFTADIMTTLACANTATGTISLSNVSGGEEPYRFSIDDSDFISTPVFTNLEGNQSYIIIIEDNVGCRLEVMAFVDALGDLSLDLGQNLSVELGEAVNISPIFDFVPTDFIWETNTTIECENFVDCDQLEFVPLESQQIKLSLFASDGCPAIDSLFIEVIDVRRVWLPNVFSPNGDGFNDSFTVFGNTDNAVIVEDFSIYDRWGSLVFNNQQFLPNDLQSGWNGQLNNETLVSGVYVYTASVRFVDEEVLLYTGEFTLIE